MDIIDRFYRWALENRWTVVLSTSDQGIDIRTHPILKGYSIDTGSAYWRFINRFSRFEYEDGSRWFLCGVDYRNTYESNEFAWNEFEMISLNNTIDLAQRERIKQWWGWHLPIALSVNGEYSYWAIDLKENVGSVVYGYEPEFEIAESVADSFEQFLLDLMSAKQ